VSNTIAVDFDGVLHDYNDGWKDGTIYGGPIPGSQDACKNLINQGYDLVVFTARQQLEPIKEWLTNNNFPEMDVTNTKIPAKFYIDDKAVRFIDWNTTLMVIYGLIGKINRSGYGK
jgi:hypothetical protein